ncbi:transcriptional regulator GlxA family with amidase domain [Rhizobium sp. BK176]|nr:transcriptional regulator GlxA family with amidase domain [Rhizobium sp. BK181]MCS3744125.1 transcriptional regulator GlxA family with amidase domain [Rhizobium sp. BK661]MCS4095817.1 transcriptional regulator GlxA family with amidase domain [Rhizobium sp. BK176]
MRIMELAPGAVLDEVALSEEFGLSRPPVRELMRQMAGEGFIELEANRAARVSSMSYQLQAGRRGRQIRQPSEGRIRARSILYAFSVCALRRYAEACERRARPFGTRDRKLAGAWKYQASDHLQLRRAGGPDPGFRRSGEFDDIVVVGGLLTAMDPVDRDTIAFAKRADAARIPLIGLCTDSFILAEAGLMTKHETCVSWLHYKEFRERFPDLAVRSDRIFNLDRQRGSCAGGSSAADIAAVLVLRYISREAERNALEVLQIEKARSAGDIQPGALCTMTMKTSA